MNIQVKRLVLSAILTALCIVATTVIAIPLPFKGYLNLGDVIVLLIAWLLPMRYAFVSAALGSMLSDILLGYTLYAPATFIIKGLMAIIANSSHHKSSSRLFKGIIAELIMVLGYLAFESILYGFGASIVNVPMNALQGVVCLVIAIQVIKIFNKSKFKI